MTERAPARLEMESLEFEFHALPWNVVFGNKASRRLPHFINQLGFKKVLVISTPGQAERAQVIAASLGDLCAGTFTGARMHVPADTVGQALEKVKQTGADCSVTIGGGSTTGLGKILALKADLPFIAIPTTYAGSEMTNIWGMTEGGKKQTGRDTKVVPLLTIYDPELTLDLPPPIAGPSGINAMAQAVVNVMTEKPNPIIAALAEDAIRVLAANLPIVVKEPHNGQARARVLYGACLAGAALGSGVTGIHHRLCHVLGGGFDTPHADTHAILLPYTVAFNSGAVPDGAGRVAAALNAEDAARGVFDLLKATGCKTSLQQIGIKASDLDDIAARAVQTPCANPRPVTLDGVRQLLQNAFEGSLSP